MADPDLDSRLEKLGKLLGKKVKLEDPPTEKEQAKSMDDTPQDEQQEVLDCRWDYEVLDETSKPPQVKGRVAKRIEPFDSSSLHAGDVADVDIRFCPWKLAKTYPDRYIGKTNRPRAMPFFNDILKGRDWDFFYLHDPQEPTKNPYLLIPTTQFEAFLEEINDKLDTELTIPAGANGDRFFLKFYDEISIRPRYLKHSEDETGLDVKSWPAINKDDFEDFLTAEKDWMYEEWMATMEIVKTGHSYGNKKSKARAIKKQQDRQKMMSDMQKFLGLSRNSRVEDIVYISVDVEALEQRPNPISEIGIAIFDSRDIGDVAPGPYAQEWRSLIKCHHLRIKEYAGLRNYRYVQGCPTRFDFGKSIFPPKATTRDSILKILKPYTRARRKIVLVGHDVSADIKYLLQVGVDILQTEGLYRQADSQSLYQHWKQENNTRALRCVLQELDIPNKNLHNAGNDAYYTLCATLALPFKQQEEDNATVQEDASGVQDDCGWQERVWSEE